VKAAASSLEGNKPEVQACYAVDGDFKNLWGSGTVRPPAWIMLDFETPKTFKTVRLFWGRSHAAIYNLEVSDDGKNWRKLYEQKECNGGVENIPLEKPVTTRYFRVLCIKPATGWGYNIFEIQLFEK
ncbi:discoidin domain-containing protein, partial [Victivallis vadensis]|uniref:discoidin domain-containing protein n=1 Tax=Victivallis vadensis TaxID=172901 RepID=UPI003AF4AABA